MPRRSRIDASGAMHHVIARGIERRRIFNDDHDRNAFLDRLGSILEQTGTCCYAWALIPNHFHLLLRTSAVPIATVMRRLLTGHAISYNRRHRRHGHLFQNRYKSILCQHDAYLLELVRYIHLNPLRAGLVQNLDRLGRYPFSGHAVIMGNIKRSWQDIDSVLSLYGRQAGQARRGYRRFVSQGIEQGRRSDLMGGGLIRSTGGWESVKSLMKAGVVIKSDERILGDSDFVQTVLSKSRETFEHQYDLKKRGFNVDTIAAQVANLMDMTVEQVWQQGKFKKQVMARSLLCYWSVRILGTTMTSMAKRLKISTSAVSKAVVRGAEIAEKYGFILDEV